MDGVLRDMCGQKKLFQLSLAWKNQGGDVFGVALEDLLVDLVQVADSLLGPPVAAKDVVAEGDSFFGLGIDFNKAAL